MIDPSCSQCIYPTQKGLHTCKQAQQIVRQRCFQCGCELTAAGAQRNGGPYCYKCKPESKRLSEDEKWAKSEEIYAQCQKLWEDVYGQPSAIIPILPNPIRFERYGYSPSLADVIDA